MYTSQDKKVKDIPLNGIFIIDLSAILSDCAGIFIFKKQSAMAYNEHLAERIKQNLESRKIKYIEKKMFGGVAFMLNEKMCIGVIKNELMLRILYEKYETVLEQDYAKPMQFTGKAMKGFVFVEPEGFETDQHLA